VGSGGVVREAEVEEGTVGEVGDEAAARSGAGIKDNRRRRHGRVWDDRRARALSGFKKSSSSNTCLSLLM
jgi:hypothetical protein